MMDPETVDELNGRLETTTVENHENGVTELRLDRPRRMNALDAQMLSDLPEAISALNRDLPDALVVTGSGRRAFSIGLDPTIFDMLGEADRPEERFRRVVGSSVDPIMGALDRLNAPVVSAMQGSAYGGGLEIAISTDMRIAGESTEIAFPEIDHGFLPAGGATQQLPALIGESRAKEIIFSDETYDAETVSDWGLFNRVVPDEDVEKEAFDLAETLASRPRNAYAGVKRAMRIHNNRRPTGFDVEHLSAGEQIPDMDYSEIK